MTDMPAWISLLGAIARGQARGAQLLETWAHNSRDRELAAVLQRIAARERDHAARFGARLHALGHVLPEQPDPLFATRLASARDAASDRQRFETLVGLDPQSAHDASRDGLERLLRHQGIDPETGALLGRFICEERDSQRQLRAQYRRVLAAGSNDRPVREQPLPAAASGPAHAPLAQRATGTRSARSDAHPQLPRVSTDTRDPGVSSGAPQSPAVDAHSVVGTTGDTAAIELAITGNVECANATRQARSPEPGPGPGPGPVQPARGPGGRASAEAEHTATSSAAALAASPADGPAAGVGVTDSPEDAASPEPERRADAAAADARLVRLRAFLDPVASR